MNGRVAKRLRREVGGQELLQGRKYTKNVRKSNGGYSAAGDGIIYLHPSMSRVAYKMEKADYYAQRRRNDG